MNCFSFMIVGIRDDATQNPDPGVEVRCDSWIFPLPVIRLIFRWVKSHVVVNVTRVEVCFDEAIKEGDWSGWRNTIGCKQKDWQQDSNHDSYPSFKDCLMHLVVFVGMDVCLSSTSSLRHFLFYLTDSLSLSLLVYLPEMPYVTFFCKFTMVCCSFISISSSLGLCCVCDSSFNRFIALDFGCVCFVSQWMDEVMRTIESKNWCLALLCSCECLHNVIIFLMRERKNNVIRNKRKRDKKAMRER